MEFAVGDIVEGKVTGITKFGAFVSLPGGRSGMVHISEIAYSYVTEISEFLSVGQAVKVKIIGMDQGKINLSIKKCQDPPQRQNQGQRRSGSGRSGTSSRGSGRSAPSSARTSSAASKEPQTFDDMLKQFMADSDSKISSIRQYSDHRTKSKRRQ